MRRTVVASLALAGTAFAAAAVLLRTEPVTTPPQDRALVLVIDHCPYPSPQ